MATGLKTFDNFTWASLLKGRTALVVDRDGVRARRYGAALEEAGAVVTLAPNQVVGADRAKDETFRMILLGLSGEETIADRFAPALSRPGTDAVILAETARHPELRERFAKARIGDHTMGDRDLVMFVIGTPDE
ncbi:MAG: hypothetical protein H7Y08_06565 [Rhizobiaceae bacterium]|nr:hypothetical protein [Rhizobiaceae bacterium]